MLTDNGSGRIKNIFLKKSESIRYPFYTPSYIDHKGARPWEILE
jgi:hypothetical protein